MSDRVRLLGFKRDTGTATPDELAELDASLAAADAKARTGTALVGGEVGAEGPIAVPAATLVPSTWDYNNGGNAKACEAWIAQNQDATHEPFVAAGGTLAGDVNKHAPLSMEDLR